MNTVLRNSLLVFAVLVIIGGGFFYFTKKEMPLLEVEQNSNINTQNQSDTEVMDKSDAAGKPTINYTGQKLAGTTSLLLDFTKEDYESALKTDTLIVLYFYANWCPICKAEVNNAFYPAFNELGEDTIIGFRVNYNDNQTDDNERNLAREFGIAYQHTKVFVKNGQRILKSPESWNKERYLTEINKYKGY